MPREDFLAKLYANAVAADARAAKEEEPLFSTKAAVAPASKKLRGSEKFLAQLFADAEIKDQESEEPSSSTNAPPRSVMAAFGKGNPDILQTHSSSPAWSSFQTTSNFGFDLMATTMLNRPGDFTQEPTLPTDLNEITDGLMRYAVCVPLIPYQPMLDKTSAGGCIYRGSRGRC